MKDKEDNYNEIMKRMELLRRSFKTKGRRGEERRPEKGSTEEQ